MAILQTSLPKASFIGSLPRPANTDEALPALSSDQQIVAWLFRVTRHRKETPAPRRMMDLRSYERTRNLRIEGLRAAGDDWQAVASLSGHTVQDFVSAGLDLPLSAAEIDHFRRNHRGTDRVIGHDFLVAKCDLPSPLAELYGLYRHRARLDTEAALFVAQATGSVRIARLMADLLSIGGFAGGHECVSHMTMTYSITAAFDTSDLIDRTCDEALRRLAQPIEAPVHLLKLSPDEISVLADNIVERHTLSATDFLEKANLLAEARQDTHRLPVSRRLPVALAEGDLPTRKPWVLRLCAAYARVFQGWMEEMPEVAALLPTGGPTLCARKDTI